MAFQGKAEMVHSEVPAAVVLGVLGLCALVYGLAGIAGAQLGESEATPDGAPIVLCSWSLVDADHDAATPFEFGADDDPAQVPSASGAPCSVDAVSRTVGQPTGVTNIAQVLPNPAGDSPVEVASFVAVTRPIGGAALAAVNATVTDPQGIERAVSAGELIACGGPEIGPEFAWAGDGGDGAGVLSAEAITNVDGTGLWDRCLQGDVDVYAARWVIEATAPCGSYEVRLAVADEVGRVTDFAHSVDVSCFTWLSLDFTELDWSVRRGSTTILVGDTDTTTPTQPTVSNLGNAPLDVGLELSALRQAESSGSLATFSAAVGTSARARVAPDEVLWFDSAGARLEPSYCAADTQPLSVSLTIPIDAEAGSYGGTFRVWARAGADAGCWSASGDE